MRLNQLFFLIIVLFSMACISTPNIRKMTPEARAKLGTIRVYYSGNSPGEAYALIQTIEGLSCRKSATSNEVVNKEEAIYALRLKASKLNADAVINLVCQHQGATFSPNCWESIICVGEAVIFLE